MPNDALIESYYNKLLPGEKSTLQAAFKGLTFVYGSRGAGDPIMAFVDRWAKRAGSTAANAVVGRRLGELSLFDAGRRFAVYSQNDYQMMDMYYGQANNNLYEKRNDSIGSFIHKCMNFMGEYNPGVSGRAMYQKTWSTELEGWHPDSPKGRSWGGLTATQAISEIIRWGVRQFGGTIIFEGYGVYYNQVFLRAPGRIGDTDLEARDLFPWFHPGESCAAFGEAGGRIIFHWAGVQTVPNHILFMLSWQWNDNRLNRPGNAVGLRALEELQNNNALNRDLWNRFIQSDREIPVAAADLAATAALLEAGAEQNWGELPAMEDLFPRTAANT